MITPGYCLVLLLSSAGGTTLPISPLRLSIPYQACVETPVLEVYLLGDPRPDLLGPAYTKCLHEKDVVKDKGSLGVPIPAKKPTPFHSQYFCEAVP